MNGIDTLPRPFDLSIRIGDRAMERMCERWLTSDQDGGTTPARTVGELLEAIQPGLTISPAIDALQLAPSATRSFHGRWGAAAPNSAHPPSERLTSMKLEFASSSLTGTVCRRSWQCPSVFLPSARADALATEVLYSGLGPRHSGVGEVIEQLVQVAAATALSASSLPASQPGAAVNAVVASWGHLLGGNDSDHWFQALFELRLRGIEPFEKGSASYRYLDTGGAMSEASGSAIQSIAKSGAPVQHQALLAWCRFLHDVLKDLGLTPPVSAVSVLLNNLIPETPPPSAGLALHEWQELTAELRTLLDSALRAPAVFAKTEGINDFVAQQGQLPLQLLNLVWLTPALLLAPLRLGSEPATTIAGPTPVPALLGVGLDGRLRVRSVQAGVRCDVVYTGADSLASLLDGVLASTITDTPAGDRVRAAAPIIGRIAATAALPENEAARQQLQPLAQRLSTSNGTADALLAASENTDVGATQPDRFHLSLSPFLLGAIAELAANLGVGTAAFADVLRPELRAGLVKLREIADGVAIGTSILTLGSMGLLYAKEVRPALNELIKMLASPAAVFQALANSTLELQLSSPASGSAAVRGTLRALGGILRVRMEMRLLPITDVAALTATDGSQPSVVELDLIDVRLQVGSLGMLDLIAAADAVHAGAEKPQELQQFLEQFFNDAAAVVASIFGSDAPAAPQSNTSPSQSPSQRIDALLASASSRATEVIRVALGRFVNLLPITQVDWHGGATLELQAKVEATTSQSSTLATGIPAVVETPWPIAANETLDPILESLQPKPAFAGDTPSLGEFVRVNALERYELEFSTSAWAPWSALTKNPIAWSGAAPCVLPAAQLSLNAAPPLQSQGPGIDQAPSFDGVFTPSGSNGRPSFSFDLWQLVTALEKGVAGQGVSGSSSEHTAILQGLIAAANSAGPHRMATVRTSAMPAQTLAWIADRIVWLNTKPKGSKAMAALPNLEVGKLIASLESLSAALANAWKLPAQLSPFEAERRRLLLVPMLTGADAEIEVQWLRAQSNAVTMESVAVPDAVRGPSAEDAGVWAPSKTVPFGDPNDRPGGHSGGG